MYRLASENVISKRYTLGTLTSLTLSPSHISHALTSLTLSHLSPLYIMSAKKSFVLRIDEATYAALEKWAADEFRSVNGQLEWLIHQALKEAGRAKGKGQEAKSKGQEAKSKGQEAKEEEGEE